MKYNYNQTLQEDRPLFVKTPFRSHSREYKRGDPYPWKELNIDKAKVLTLYTQSFLHHNDELEVERKIGDGLEAFTIQELEILVNGINEKVKLATNSDHEFLRKKCKKSKVVSKQRGLIRSWRRVYGELEA
jgi:hypothetical protein